MAKNQIEHISSVLCGSVPKRPRRRVEEFDAMKHVFADGRRCLICEDSSITSGVVSFPAKDSDRLDVVVYFLCGNCACFATVEAVMSRLESFLNRPFVLPIVNKTAPVDAEPVEGLRQTAGQKGRRICAGGRDFV